MQMRTLGRSGLAVSRIGLGLAALGRPGYINLDHSEDMAGDYEVTAMQAHTHRVLDAAWARGVRYFDAARSYGRAEEFLGSWLRGRDIGPVEVTVGSKWGYTYTAGWQVEAETHEVKEHSLAVLERQRDESDARLGSYLKLYQVHSATLASGILSAADVLAALAGYKADGLTIGLSVSGQGQAETLRRAMDVHIDGQPLFDCVQATWNLLERSAGEALSEAHAAGMGVIVKEALANGRLTDRNDDPEFEQNRSLLQNAAEQHGTSLDALALGVVLSQPWADVVLSGAAQAEHLESNLQALDVRVSADDMAELDRLVEPPDIYWQKRAALRWN